MAKLNLKLVLAMMYKLNILYKIMQQLKAQIGFKICKNSLTKRRIRIYRILVFTMVFKEIIKMLVKNKLQHKRKFLFMIIYLKKRVTLK